MLKVMLVDDDVPMIKYLVKLIHWKEQGLEVTATAHSGKKALQLFRETNPDIVITDIGMPQMDGLELAGELKRIKPEIRILFLTCHEEFHYARKAVQLDADDYLIKDELSREQLEASLKKAAQEVKDQQTQLGEWTYKQDLMKNKDVLKERFFAQMLSGSSPEEMLSFGKRLGFEWNHSHFIVAIGYLNYASFPKQYRYEDVPVLLYAISNIAEELSADTNLVTTLTDTEAYFVCVANYQPNLSLNTVEQFQQLLSALRTKIKEYLKVDASIFYGQPFKGIEGIKQQYKQLKQTDRSAYYEDLTFGPMPALGNKMWSVDVTGVLGEEWSRIVRSFKDKDEQQTNQALSEMKQKAYRHQLDPGEFMAKCSQWIRVLELESNEHSDESFHDCMVRCRRLDQSMLLMEKKIKQLMSANPDPGFERKPKLQQIDQFIAEHLSENISLVDIADYLFLNPSYLSRYFKQETGMNFTDYVHRHKMKIACHMLKSKQDNIERIAFKLGYMERTYFSKIFKKYVGVSPKDYR
ncbi:response regulator transcription factor [Paenibacillus sp. UNC451MF]|uniref:response regulator transcription factor n=1 Tax=Paenibacillus sp. UNC451MF TaxID=1449063 RepID=UPI00048F0A62|nr:response regulator [Paenibacillus sp. UNC451MF]